MRYVNKYISFYFYILDKIKKICYNYIITERRSTMTFIPRKDEYNNEQPQSSATTYNREPSVDWVGMIEETGVLQGIMFLFCSFTIFMNVITMPCLFGADEKGLMSVNVTLTCDAIIVIFLALHVISYFQLNGFVGLVRDILSFIGIFGRHSEKSFEQIQDEMKEDNDRWKKEHQETADRCAKYYEKKDNTDGKDFNTRQKEARKEAAYASADPEFIVTYKSKGGCWVKDIVRGRDKAEVYNRYKFNPMVQYMGGVTGIYE